MKYTIAATLSLLLCCLAAGAQNTQSYRDRLSRADGAAGAKAEVVEYGDAGSVIKMLESSKSITKVNGYRVRIYFDNNQNARSEANSALNRFKDEFPDIPVFLNYENPYFKVSAGNCLTNEEAIILWGQVKGSFPKAFPTRESIPLSALAE